MDREGEAGRVGALDYLQGIVDGLHVVVSEEPQTVPSKQEQQHLFMERLHQTLSSNPTLLHQRIPL